MSDRISKLQKNVDAIRTRIADATAKAGRKENSVTLVAVTKYVDDAMIRDLVAAGCTDCGENRPQAFWSKADSLADLPIRWHQIGHLQRNKLKRTLPATYFIHSVDSLRLLKAIDETQVQLDPGTTQKLLLEVNISGDEAKHGFTEHAIGEAVELALTLDSVELQGFMGMAGLGTTPAEAQLHFAKLRTIQERMCSQFPSANLSELSMGMSGDFEQAIAEGATLVRVGSALFKDVE